MHGDDDSSPKSAEIDDVDGATSTAHPVRPRVSLLKELCTSPDCYVGCYPTIAKEVAGHCAT